jgi:hypothetical protein
VPIIKPAQRHEKKTQKQYKQNKNNMAEKEVLKKSTVAAEAPNPEQTQTGTDRHRQTQTGTDRHRQAQTGTDRHRQTQTGTDRHRQAQTGTETSAVQ